MKIVLIGGGTGGHFYPLIAVAEEVRTLVGQQKLIDAELYYLAASPYDERLLFENDIKYIYIPAGKWRRYFSLKNLVDGFGVARGVILAIINLYRLYPDVVFSKGGYMSFPILFAARLLRIPVVIHESDSLPGRVSLWSGKFAIRIAVSYPEAKSYFPAAKTAVTGNPIRRDLKYPIKNGAHEFLRLSPDKPIIFVTGGSQGALALNEVVLDILPDLLKRYHVVHQVGSDHFDDIKKRADYLVTTTLERGSYKLFENLQSSALRLVAGVAELIITRAGSVLFEIALWGIPAIVIPIPENVSRDQRTNAFTYARAGAAVVIEQGNLTPSVLLGEIDRLMGNNTLRTEMQAAAKRFSSPDAAHLIAAQLINIALKHEGG